MIDEKWLSEWRPVARGVPSEEFPELLSNTTWFLRYDDAEEDARWVVPQGEPAFVEVGVARVDDLEDINEAAGWVTIEDGKVDVRQLVSITR